LLTAIAATSHSAVAGLSQFSAGVTLPRPLSTDASEMLNRPVGVAGQVWIQGPSEMLEFNLSLEYLPFKLKNTTSDDIQLNVNMIGAYAGATIWGGPSLLGMRPYLSADIGLMYDFLTLPKSSGTISNTGTAFAMRAAPGLDIPVVSGLGLMVEFPVTLAIFKTPLSLWASTFSLRWKL
jgi:hypothetical protein